MVSQSFSIFGTTNFLVPDSSSIGRSLSSQFLTPNTFAESQLRHFSKFLVGSHCHQWQKQDPKTTIHYCLKYTLCKWIYRYLLGLYGLKKSTRFETLAPFALHCPRLIQVVKRKETNKNNNIRQIMCIEYVPGIPLAIVMSALIISRTVS